MLSLNLQPIFKARSIERPYTFLVKAGFPPYTATKLLNSNTRIFRLDHIEKLCTLLNCTPNDLLVWKPTKNTTIAQNHPIQRLKNQIIDNNWQETLKTMPLEQLNQIAVLINQQKQP